VALGMVAAMATLTAGATIGIDVGLLGDNLPPVKEIVQLLKSRGVTNVRIYDAAPNVLSEFANQGIKVSVTVPNDVLVGIANSQQVATSWVQQFVHPFVYFIDRVVVGNEWLSDTTHDPSKLLPAMENVYTALTSLGLDKRVTTAHAFDIVQGFPPSAGTFRNSAVMGSILDFLKRTDSAIMVNIYPYFTYVANTAAVNINYALGNPGAPSTLDSGSGITYKNLLDAQVDTVISAMTKLGYGPEVRFIIGESGWPSAGGLAATTDNARTYNQNLVQHALGGNGSPLRPGINFPTYIFALFNENNKSPGIEKNFGLYHPDKTPVYPVNLSV
jgi:exo-beta-1,3-glucanase (GH17 family)